MAVIHKDNVSRPSFPKEVIENLTEFGGDIIVQGLSLTARLDFFNKSGSAKLPFLLANTIVDMELTPIFNEEEWQAFGANNFNLCLELAKKSQEISGLIAEINEKKS